MKQMIKKMTLVALLFLVATITAVSVLASDSIKIVVNGKQIDSDVAPQIVDGHVMVPIRFVAEAFEADVTWDSQNRQVIINDSTTKTSGEFVVTSLSDSNYVIYHDKERRPVDEHDVPIFINGELVKNSGILYEEGFLVQIEILSKLLSAELISNNGNWSIENEQSTILLNENEGFVEINENKESIMIENINGDTYLDIEVLIPYLDWTSSYYYQDRDQNDQSLVPHNNAIYLDEALTEIIVESAEDGKDLAQTLASEALENYTVSIRKNLEESGEDPTRMDSTLHFINEDIKSMRYAGEVSKYYMYEMEVYRVFVDRTNGNIYFNYTTGLATYNVLVDVNDPHLFTPLYMVG